MAYTDESVRAKLSALNETQESIVTVAQWIMFHRRHADKTAGLWLQRLKDSGAPKRLNLLYLANEVIQQSKIRRKDDFLTAFSPIIAEATSIAYKGSTQDVQQKLRRVIEVWRSRTIFDVAVQDDIEARINQLDKSKPQTTRPLLGGTLFSSGSSSTGVPSELQALVPLQLAQTRAVVAVKPAMTSSTTEYEKLTDSSQPTPSPPVHAARLSSLLKSLASAESAVSESVKTRQALINGLEAILADNRKALSNEDTQLAEISRRRQNIEAKKREVEDAIMRGMSADDSTTPIGSPNAAVGGAAFNSMAAGFDDGPGFAPSFDADNKDDDDDEVVRHSIVPLIPPTAIAPLPPPTAIAPLTPPSAIVPLTPPPVEDEADGLVAMIFGDEQIQAATTIDPRNRPSAGVSQRTSVDPRLKRRAEEESNIANGQTLTNGGLNGLSSSLKRRKSSHEEDEFDALEFDEDVVGMLG